eukprot:scaffold1138_cov128-Cylindrotheca_fusiformis.AAC.22
MSFTRTLIAALSLLLCTCIGTESISPSREKLTSSKSANNCIFASEPSQIDSLSVRGGSNSPSQLGDEDVSSIGVDTTNNSTASNETQLGSIVEVATKLRLEGKDLHDKGDFESAAELFGKAANTLQQLDQAEQTEEYVTCILHQALCYLKSKNYRLCLEACTSILQDDKPQYNHLNPAISTPAVRARAYHRRAKAKVGLGDPSGALHDARSAAFLGDRKAVALYGRLMRETPLSPIQPSSTPNQFSHQAPPNDILLESLLNKSGRHSSGYSMPELSPSSLLMGGGPQNLIGSLGSGSNGLAKSVIQSLSKRLEEEETQTTICNYLKKTNKTQLQQLAAMAGLSNAVRESDLDRLVKFCHGVTPRTIRRTVRTGKGAVYGIKVIRRTVAVLNKYKSLLVALILLQWTKSACMRPIPVDRMTARRATKRALKNAMKANRNS